MGGMAALSVHPWVLYAFILLLSGYIVIDLVANHTSDTTDNCHGRSLGSAGLWSAKKDVVSEPDAYCKTIEGHMDREKETRKRKKKKKNEGAGVAASEEEVEAEEEAEDPWKQMKWTGEAAACRVKGHLIERLDPDNNFRRGFALRMTGDVEDKTHVLPWLLGSRVDLNKAKRRVYLDLGANAFSTSITWFMRMYPCDFTEVHAFEIDPKLLRIPTPGSFDEATNIAGPNQFSLSLKTRPGVPAWMVSRIHLYNKFVSDFDDDENKAVNITRFMKEELRLRADDTVVVKMDIEGSEWPILHRWMQDPEMASIVDELFVEVHYDHPSMHAYHWARFAPRTRDDALRLLAELRWHGFYAHAWP